MRKTKRQLINLILVSLSFLVGFLMYANSPVQASVTLNGDVYHITTGQDLYSLLGQGNTTGYWTSANPAPASLKIAVDNDITYPDVGTNINSNTTASIDVDFQNHAYYVKNQVGSYLVMTPTNLNLNVTVHNVESNRAYASTVSGTVTVPDPANATTTTTGYVLSYYSLFSGNWASTPTATFNGSLTYDNVDINFPSLTDTGAQMLSLYYVPLKLTGTNRLVVKGNSGQEFAEMGELEVVSGTTTLTYGQSGSPGAYGMFHECYEGSGSGTTTHFIVDGGATLNMANHSNMPTFYFSDTRALILTNNGTFTFMQDGLPVTNTSATNAFIGGTTNSSTTVNFGTNALTNMTTTTTLWSMGIAGQFIMNASTGSDTTMTSTNTSGNAANRLFNGTATTGSVINIGSVKQFGVFATSTPPMQTNTLLLNMTGSRLGITSYATGNTTPHYYYAAEAGSISANWKDNDNTSPQMTVGTSAVPLYSDYGVSWAPGLLEIAGIQGNAVWNYNLSDSIFPVDNSPVWLARNGGGDNTQIFDIIDSRNNVANFQINAIVSDTSRSYGFKKNDGTILNLSDEAANILNGTDFTQGANGAVSTAGHWTYTTDANHGLLVQSSRADKVGAFTGAITYSVIDALQ